MLRPRLIPVLLLKGNVLVKTIRFKDHKYIGDPINAVSIFNDLGADELVFLDINASHENRTISPELVREIGEEADVPFSVGGGIRSIKDIQNIIAAGAEKVVIGSYAVENPEFIKNASEKFGSSSIAVCIDVKKTFLKGQKVYKEGGAHSTSLDVVHFARLMEKMGAGEIIVQSIDKDGSMNGYDIDLVRAVVDAVTIPVIALGGAGTQNDLVDLMKSCAVSGLAAGSLFVFHNQKRGVLINYPEDKSWLRKIQLSSM